MNIPKYFANQMRQPSGWFGKWLLRPLWNRRNIRLNDVTLDCLELKETDRVLEIGFGGGFLLGRMSLKLTRGLTAGLDASPVMVEAFKKRNLKALDEGKMDVRLGKAEKPPFSDGTFDKICSVNSIFYWNDARKAIWQFYRILRKPGRLVLTFTRSEDLKHKNFVKQGGLKPFTEQEVRQMMTEAGFRDIRAVQNRDRHREFITLTGQK